MAKMDLRVRLIPDTRELDKALKTKKAGLGSAASTGTKGVGADVSIKGFGKLLGLVGGMGLVLSSLDFIIKPVMSLLKAVLALLFIPLIPIMKPAMIALAKFVPPLLNVMKKIEGFVEKVVLFFSRPAENVLKDIFNLENIKKSAKEFAKFFFNLGKDFLGPIVLSVGKFFFDMGVALGDIISNMIRGLFNVGMKLGEKLANAWQNSLEFLKSLGTRIWDSLKGAFAFVRDTLKNTIRSIANGIIGFANRLIPGSRFDIPRLASGGIVTKPTLALIGERGPEAVVPLSQGGFGGPMTININNPIVREERDLRKIADSVSRVLMKQNRRNFS